MIYELFSNILKSLSNYETIEKGIFGFIILIFIINVTKLIYYFCKTNELTYFYNIIRMIAEFIAVTFAVVYVYSKLMYIPNSYFYNNQIPTKFFMILIWATWIYTSSELMSKKCKLAKIKNNSQINT